MVRAFLAFKSPFSPMTTSPDAIYTVILARAGVLGTPTERISDQDLDCLLVSSVLSFDLRCNIFEKSIVHEVRMQVSRPVHTPERSYSARKHLLHRNGK